MSHAKRRRVLSASALAFVVASLAGGLALQLLSGGIRVRSLSPAVLALALALLGSLVVMHRPGLRLGPLLLVNALAFGAGTLAAGALDYGTTEGIARPFGRLAFAVVAATATMNAAWALFILWFPDGRFASRAWRRFFYAGAAVTAVVALAAWLAGPSDRIFGFYGGTSIPRGVGGPFADTWAPLQDLVTATLAFPLIALASLAQRQRRASGVVRQQARWLFAALAADVVVQVGTAPFGGRPGWVGTTASTLALVANPLPVAAACAAILRYRLWDIEIVVSRALVHGLLWAVLSALLLVPGFAAGLLVGGHDAAAAVALALVVTVVFQPIRARVERLADRLVYRHRPRPYALLTGFWDTLRTAEIDRLGPLLAAAMRDGLGVSWAGAWLYSQSPSAATLRPLAVAGTQFAPSIPVPRAVARHLRASPGLVLPDAPPPELLALWDEAPAAIVPLVAADQLVGLLACGERRADPLGAGDFEALELLARSCALRLRNLRLEGELRERLAQIESQARSLLHSRRRLVGAQDEERRRIERNLHDGVQQQLVALAVRLQRAAAAGDPLLADLADEAEQAVFALQELGRGIYPGVLVDRGLAAALRTQAARMPLAVQVVVDERLVAERLPPDVEASLYFVALEALTNVQKHAPGASVGVRLAGDGGHLVLEVVDDGPGFVRRPSAGSGLQNMEDRVAAVDGAFSVESGAAGTRISAAVPVRSAGARLAQVDEHGADPPVELGLRGKA